MPSAVSPAPAPTRARRPRPVPAGPRRWPVTVEAYHALAASGVIGPEERVELVHGQILATSPVGALHITLVNRLTMHFARTILQEEQAIDVQVRSALRLGPTDEPEPDVALLRTGRSPREMPTAADTLLVVEVADATLRFDRGPKRARYARAGVPEVWVVDVAGGTVEVARGPLTDEGAYAEIRRLGAGATLDVAGAPGLPPLALDALFTGLLDT